MLRGTRASSANTCTSSSLTRWIAGVQQHRPG
jgi:hypothetical protein